MRKVEITSRQYVKPNEKEIQLIRCAQVQGIMRHEDVIVRHIGLSFMRKDQRQVVFQLQTTRST
jgi:hypothetical protein